jgi:hypothetical protein
VPLELFVAALSAAAGPDCAIDELIAGRPNGCLFYAPVLHGGSPAPELGP